MEQYAASLLYRARKAASDEELESVLTEMTTHGVSIDPLLLIAASRDRLSDMVALLAHGANVDAVDARGRTALHCALENSNADCVDLLLEHGASVHVQDGNGHTPMAALIHRSTFNTELQTAGCMAMLHAQGAQMPPHHVVWNLVWFWKDHASKPKSYFVAWLLSFYRIDPNAADPITGDTALHYLARRTAISLKTLRILLRKGANPNVRNAHGYTPLIEANGDPAAIATLLAYGADPHMASMSGWTPLMSATRSPVAVVLLLRRNVDMRATWEGRTALCIAYDASKDPDSTDHSRAMAAECANLIAIKLRNQQAFIYAHALYKARRVPRDMRTLMVLTFGKMFTVEGAINTGQHDMKRVARIE